MAPVNTSNGSNSRGAGGSEMLTRYLAGNDDPWSSSALRAADASATKKSRQSQEKKSDAAAHTTRGSSGAAKR